MQAGLNVVTEKGTLLTMGVLELQILSDMLINLHDMQTEILKFLALVLLLQHLLTSKKAEYSFYFVKIETIITYLKFIVSSSPRTKCTFKPQIRF